MKARYVGEVELDARRRVTLGRAGKAAHTRYQVEEDERGVLTLTPLISLPITAIDGKLAAAIEEANAGRVSEVPEDWRGSVDETR